MLKTIISLVVILASAALLFFRFAGLPPGSEAAPHVGIGEALAEQAGKALGSGGRIVLIAPDSSTFQYPGYEIQLKTLHSRLRKAHLSVASTNLIKLDPLYLARVSPGEFANILRKQSESDVVVSLLAPPVLTAEEKAKLPPKRPRVVALCSGDMPRTVNLKSFFDDELLFVAIVSRTGLTAARPATNDPQAWFNHFYQVITAANVGELPPPARAMNP